MDKNLMRAYAEASTQLEAARAKLAKTLAAEYAKIGKALGSRIVGFQWDQYTPHFNDGEPCRFSIYDIWDITYLDDEGEEQTLEFYGSDFAKYAKDESNGDEELEAQLLAALKAAASVSEFNGEHADVLEDAFGDGVTVRISKDGVDVEECDHD